MFTAVHLSFRGGNPPRQPGKIFLLGCLIDYYMLNTRSNTQNQ
nr:MAG TPA: hypothetical protein [Caudoviricetes sp.]